MAEPEPLSRHRHARHNQALAHELDSANAAKASRSFEYAPLDSAVARIEAHLIDACRVAKRRFIGGLTDEETPAFLNISEATVKRIRFFARTNPRQRDGSSSASRGHTERRVDSDLGRSAPISKFHRRLASSPRQ
jgi:hypothetical protein